MHKHCRSNVKTTLFFGSLKFLRKSNEQIILYFVQNYNINYPPLASFINFLSLSWCAKRRRRLQHNIITSIAVTDNEHEYSLVKTNWQKLCSSRRKQIVGFAPRAINYINSLRFDFSFNSIIISISSLLR